MGNRRLYIINNKNETYKNVLRKPGYMIDKRWYTLRDTVRRELALNQEFELRPGDELGRLMIETESSNLTDVMHPFPGQIIIRQNVVELLAESDLHGFNLQKAIVSNLKKSPNHVSEHLNLYELIPKGYAWRIGIDQNSIEVCDTCKRRIFPRPTHWEIDLERWDGSDFFIMDLNPNMVFVTQAVKDLFESNNVSNCLFVSPDKLRFEFGLQIQK
jgi:hypothetical protein